MSIKPVLGMCGMSTLLSLLLSALAVVSCQKIPAEYRDFLSLPLSQQKEQMRTLPIDKQIDYYLAGMTYVHPPLLELGDVIASEGKEAVPHLTDRLKREKREFRQVDLMYVFDAMNRYYYNLKDEKEAISLLAEITRNMKDHKSEAERLFRGIIENQPVDLEKFKQERPQYFPVDPNKKP